MFPSFIPLSVFLLSHAVTSQDQSQLVLSPQVPSVRSACPPNLPTSCHLPSNAGSINSCCTNVPGGQLLLTQVRLSFYLRIISRTGFDLQIYYFVVLGFSSFHWSSYQLDYAWVRHSLLSNVDLITMFIQLLLVAYTCRLISLWVCHSHTEIQNHVHPYVALLTSILDVPSQTTAMERTRLRVTPREPTRTSLKFSRTAAAKKLWIL